MAELKYSKSGTPYIKTPFGNIIFSKTTKTAKGYGWFTINGRAFDCSFEKITVLPVDFRKTMKKIFTSFANDGYISESSLPLLSEVLKNTDFEEIYNPKPKRKYKKRIP